MNKIKNEMYQKVKNMWIKYETGEYMKESSRINFGDMDGVMLIDIDSGLAWSPKGKEHSQPDKDSGWVWGNPNEDVIINYINNLYTDTWEKNGKEKKGYIPILYSKSTKNETKEAIVQMEIDLEYRPFIIIGVSLEEVENLVSEHFSKRNKHLFLNDDYDFVTIPKMSKEYEGLNLDDLGLSASDNYPDPAPHKIGILIGQQGSGKSDYCNFLQEKGYIIIDEKEAGKIRNRTTKKAITNFKELINEVLDCKKLQSKQSKTKDCKKKRGIIIDATNPSEESRETYNTIANEMGITVVNLWLSKSGWDYNSRRGVDKVSRIALNIYSSKLELPETYIRVL